jgi:hypothetical protein
MADRYPLIANPQTNRIEELAAGDDLNLLNSSIVGATTVTSDKFIGDLEGIAEYADTLIYAENILSGTISTSRLDGYYPIEVDYARGADADGISNGTIPRNVLSGEYDINISGTANLANTLQDAANINEGIINANRLSGVYNISITGSSYQTEISNVVSVASTDANLTHYITFASPAQEDYSLIYKDSGYLYYNPGLNRLGLGTALPNYNLEVVGNVNIKGPLSVGSTQVISSNRQLQNILSIDAVTKDTLETALELDPNNFDSLYISGIGTFAGKLNAEDGLDVAGGLAADIGTITTIYGNGVNVTGIVTQITAGIGVRISSTQEPGKGVVNIDAYHPIGRTIFVTQTGNDSNSGLAENDAKKTIKAAAAIAFPGDTVKVYPGVYVEENPIYLRKLTAVEGTELRNCVVTPRFPDRDLFYTNNGCHITDLSFIGPTMSNGASIVSLQPLLGVSDDRFFDAARMIRSNLDFIAKEAVGFLTSTQYIGAGRTQITDPVFRVTNAQGNPVSPDKCVSDIKLILKSVIHDITRGGNSKCVGAAKSYFTDSGSLLHISGTDVNGYNIKQATIDTIRYAAGIARSCVNNIDRDVSYQSNYFQLKDLSMQIDPLTGSNENMNSCSNVISAIYSCVGVVTTILNSGISVLGSGINTTFPANAGRGTDSIVGITSAVYDNITGQTKITAPGYPVKSGDIVEFRDLIFECESGPSIGTQRYPSGAYGYEFFVTDVDQSGFTVNTGVSTIPHTYVGGGYVVDRSVAVTTAIYDNVTGIVTITAPGAYFRVGDFVKIYDLQFSCNSGAGTTTIYPTGNLGYKFIVDQVIGAGTTFVCNVGTSTITHSYVSGGVVFPPYSPGVEPITQGPYVRNCTNFVPGSIGMRVDGFHAEPGDRDDIGVTGTMSVDSYTQYNQGGIGVSITNGAYAQLVSIFTICDDIAIFTGSGGQCDITNSNSSFGRLGLVSDGVGDFSTKSIYRQTGIVNANAQVEQAIVEVSGLGNQRPYDGQAIYFGELFYRVDGVRITNPGSGYTEPPNITIDFPSGDNGIRAEAICEINSSGQVSSIDMVSSGSQYRLTDNPQVTISSPVSGTTATAELIFYPLYYTIESATLPSSGISTIVLNTNLNNTVSIGTTVYLNRLSLQIVSSHSFEWVGSGNDINRAKPSLGGVVDQAAEVVKLNGGEVVYTSTDQAGNFRIGDDVVINQITGTITGRAFSQSLLNTVTPLIIALGR